MEEVRSIAAAGPLTGTCVLRAPATPRVRPDNTLRRPRALPSQPPAQRQVARVKRSLRLFLTDV